MCFSLLFFFTIYGHDSQCSATFEQTLDPVSTARLTCLVEIGQEVTEELFKNIMILYMYTVQGQGKITFTE